MGYRELTRTFVQSPHRLFTPCPDGTWVQARGPGAPCVCPGIMNAGGTSIGQVNVFCFQVRRLPGLKFYLRAIWSHPSRPSSPGAPEKVCLSLNPVAMAYWQMTQQSRTGGVTGESTYHSHSTETRDPKRTQTPCLRNQSHIEWADLTAGNMTSTMSHSRIGRPVCLDTESLDPPHTSS